MLNCKTKYTFAILGGDRRQAVIANELIALGQEVRLFGLGEAGFSCIGGTVCTDIAKALEGCNAVILPLPVTRNRVDLSMPLCQDERIDITELIETIKRSGCSYVFGGNLPAQFTKLEQENGIIVCDYYKHEGLQRKNALASAEGALMLTMEHTDITVSGLKALVCGYGRIGSMLAEMLDRLGADVTVAARRDEVLCEASLNGFKTARLGGDTEYLRAAVESSDVILNTVPHMILTETVIKGCSKKQLYIEIASSPGGIDLAKARDVGIRTVFAPSLPGRYAPISAGKYIFDTIKEILAERGMNL